MEQSVGVRLSPSAPPKFRFPLSNLVTRIMINKKKGSNSPPTEFTERIARLLLSFISGLSQFLPAEDSLCK